MDREIVDEIAAYLRRHPRAADTAHGIRMWWLARGDTVPEERLVSALEYMVKEQMLSRRVLADRRTVYGAVDECR
jgi:hypothetical protein